MDYINLGIVLDYTLLNSLITVDKLIDYAKKNSISVLGILNDNLYSSMEFYNKSFETFKDILNENDPLFAGLYNNMALALQDLKEYSKAEEYFSKAIEITEINEKNELETAISLVNLAHLYYEINAEDERINGLMDKAADILDCPDYFGLSLG